MRDRVPQFPGRVQLMPVAGQANTYDLVRADQPQDDGTPLNKSTLLTDATAMLLGLNPEDNPTVDDALRAAPTTAILNVTTLPGATVEITQGSITLSAVADEDGLAVLHPHKLGEWDYLVTAGEDTYTGTIAVPTISIIDLTVGLSFAAMSWDMIDAVAQSGQASTIFAVGDEKDVKLSTGEIITVRIEDFDHDDLASGGKAPISIMMRHLLAAKQRMNSSDTNVGSWNASEMRSTRMPSYLSQLPADLRAVIKPVIKKTTAGNQQTTIQNTTDSLWLAASVEVGFETTGAGYKDEGTPYPLFVDNASRIKKLSNGAGAANYYWLRSPYTGDATFFRFVDTGGSSGNAYTASSSLGVCLGFCI